MIYHIKKYMINYKNYKNYKNNYFTNPYDKNMR